MDKYLFKMRARASSNTKDNLSCVFQCTADLVWHEYIFILKAWPREVNLSLTKFPKTGIGFQSHGQLSCPLVVDLVIAQIQVLDVTIGAKALAENGKAFFPHTQVVPFQSETGVGSGEESKTKAKRPR